MESRSSFSSGTTVLGTGSLASGVATLTTSSLPTGIDTIMATYTTDHAFGGSSGALSQTVRPATLTVTADNASRVYGAANPTFTGKVSGAVNGDIFTVSGSTTATQASSTGGYAIVPSISGPHMSDYNLTTINGALTITPAPLTITSDDATRTFGSPNPAFTGKVIGAVHGDTFTVSGSTTATQTSPPGTYSIVPSVSGAHVSDYNVTTADGKLTITQAIPAIKLSSSAAAVFQSDPVTLTAVVSSSAGTPSGTVSFFDGDTLLNQASLTSGNASYQASSLAIGAHTITAAYSGDTNFASVKSNGETVAVVTFMISIPSGSSSSATVSPGGSATYTLSFAPPSGATFPDEIKLSVSGAPAGATSTFNPSSIAAGAGATNVKLTITLPSSAAAQPAPGPFGRRALPIALGVLVLPLLLPLRRRSRKWFLAGCVSVLCLAVLSSISGCDGGSGISGGGGGQSQTYTLTVSATSGSLSNSTKLTLTVE